MKCRVMDNGNDEVVEGGVGKDTGQVESREGESYQTASTFFLLFLFPSPFEKKNFLSNWPAAPLRHRSMALPSSIQCMCLDLQKKKKKFRPEILAGAL